MFVVTNRVPVAKEWWERFEERFRNRAGQVEKQVGFLSMEILRPVSPDTPYVVRTVWEDHAAFEAWIRSDDFQAAHRNPLPKEAYAGQGGLEQHEIVIQARRP
ncbi:MAG: antibiotic biosynthesis monooxygenase [Chromatiales bacterium 21-64-14]|nr:MAG: antibiotic biosynthesis monooxygenase [Chromatiales bacterium 21-64-14]HQU15839.1 antibiotic biosynthesis monooxygenase [Gammaproteobacteria bacterium]